MPKQERKARKPVPVAKRQPRDEDDGEETKAAKPAAKPAASEKATGSAPGTLKRRLKPREDPTGASTGPNDRVHAPRPVHSLDNRDLSKIPKKGKQRLAEWRGQNHGKKLDKYMQGMMSASRRKFGHNAVFAGHTDENMIVGIPCPLAFEYLLCQDVFPLGLIYQIVGLAGSLKSSLIYEIMRWFRNAGGGSHLEEVETKFSPELMRSIVGYAEDETNVIVDRCDSVEDWQRKLLYNIDQQKELLTWEDKANKIPGPGRTVPICFAVDSVSGKLSMETQEKVNDQGFHGRSFPIEAMSITGFMKTVPQMIDGWPFALVLNNHLKMGKDDQGHDVRRITGGAGLNFQESFELETKVRKSKIECSEWEGIQIGIRCTKNSFGPTHRRIDARMLWWEEMNEETGDYDQITRWDWHWSTVQLLTGENMLSAMIRARLKEAGVHVDAPKKADVENLAWSKNLGMKKEDAVPWSELGAMIAKDTVLLNTIRQCLGIKRRPLLQGDYLQQLEGLREQLP